MFGFLFSIVGAFIGGFLGLAVCGNCGHSTGDAIGAVVGLFYMAVGAVVGLLVGGICGVIFSRATVTRVSPVESQFDPRGADEWVDGDADCPHSGLWIARVDDDHELAGIFNVWNRTARVTKGDRFPSPSTMVAGVTVANVKWKCVDAFGQLAYPEV